MSIELHPMIGLVRKFLNEHFPNDQHKIVDMEKYLEITVFHLNVYKLFFRVTKSGFVYSVSIHQDHFKDIQSLFCLGEYKQSSTIILNNFITLVNENPFFNQVFNPLKLLDFTLYMKLSTSGSYRDIFDHDKKFNMNSKIISVKQPAVFQFSFRFTANNTLKYLPSISLFNETDYNFPVCFDLDTQSIYLMTSNNIIYDDFFINNKVLNVNEDLQPLVIKFVDYVIYNYNQKNPKDPLPFNSDDSFYNKVSLLAMINI